MNRHLKWKPMYQYTLEDMFNTISNLENANQGHNEIPFYAHLIG